MSFSNQGFLNCFVSEFKIIYDCEAEEKGPLGRAEIEVAKKVLKYFESIRNFDLYIYGSESDEEDDELISDSDDEKHDPDDSYEIEEEKHKEDSEISFEYMEKVVNYSEKYPTHGFKSLKVRFKKLKHKIQFCRWKKYVEEKGRKSDKWKQINAAVFEKYRCARNLFHPVRDIDLQRWAIQKARQLNFVFSGSSHWVYSFKKMHSIVSRKVSTRIFEFEEI